jgi:hypothetical protein
MTPDRVWLEARLEDAPPALRDAVLRAWEAASGGEGVTARCVEAACALLADERVALERGRAFDLLAADALVTLACEAAAETAPDRLAEIARALGPAGRLGAAGR